MRANESNSATREGQAEMCEKHLTVPCLTAWQLSTEQERPEQNPVREDGDRSPPGFSHALWGWVLLTEPLPP